MRIRNQEGRKLNCSKCGKPKEPTRLNQGYCKKCHAEHMRKTRPKLNELSPQRKKKAAARAFAREYSRRGKIYRLPCQICGNEKTERHHPDYEKPLEVIWLCRKCHLELHRKEK